jgi:hypothetical protein
MKILISERAFDTKTTRELSNKGQIARMRSKRRLKILRAEMEDPFAILMRRAY